MCNSENGDENLSDNEDETETEFKLTMYQLHGQILMLVLLINFTLQDILHVLFQLYIQGEMLTHWKYFALNSQMQWRALQEGRVYVKQTLNGRQLTIEEVQEMVDENNHLADQVIQFGKSLHGTRQFWNKRRGELSDMIKQIGPQGLIFFTFSAADLHWPELHKLMSYNKNQISESESEQNTAKQR